MRFDARAWLERLSLSFIVIALVLGWEGYKRSTQQPLSVDAVRPWVYFVSAAACGIVGLIGAGLRHRGRD